MSCQKVRDEKLLLERDRNRRKKESITNKPLPRINPRIGASEIPSCESFKGFNLIEKFFLLKFRMKLLTNL